MIDARKTLFSSIWIGCLLLVPGASAQSGRIDPLTGARVDSPVETRADADEADATPPRADLGQANELVREQKYAEAEALLADLQQEFADDPALLLMRGELLLALGRADEALKPLERAAEIDPARPRAHFQLATALSAAGDAEGALAAFGREIEHNDDAQVAALARLNRAMLFQQQRNWIDAAQELESLLEAQPERSEAYGDLTTLYLQADRVDDAAATLERGKEAGFLSSQHYYSLGARLYKDGRYEGAVRALEAALEIEPRLARAERSLGAALQKLERPQEAIEHLERYLELSPGAADAENIAKQIETAKQG